MANTTPNIIEVMQGSEIGDLGTFRSFIYVMGCGRSPYVPAILEKAGKVLKKDGGKDCGITMKDFFDEVCQEAEEGRVIERHNLFFFDQKNEMRNAATLGSRSMRRSSYSSPSVGASAPASSAVGGFKRAEYLIPDGLILRLYVNQVMPRGTARFMGDDHRAYIYLKTSHKAPKIEINATIKGQQCKVISGRFILMTKEQVLAEANETVTFHIIKYLETSSYLNFLRVVEVEPALVGSTVSENVKVDFIGQEVTLIKKKAVRRTI